MRRIDDFKLAAALRVREQIVNGQPDRCIGKPCLQFDRLHYGPHTPDIAERNQQRRVGFHVAQQAHDVGIIPRFHDRMLGVGKNAFKAPLGIVFEKRSQALRRGA